MKNLFLSSLILITMLPAVYAQDAQPGSYRYPFSFRENNGQITDQHGQQRMDIDFVLQAPDMVLMVGDAQLHYQFVKQESTGPDTIQRRRTTIIEKHKQLPKSGYRTPALKTYRLDVVLLNANKEAEVIKENKREEQYRYYNPKDGSQGTKTVNAYKKITYKNIYPHIDWVLYLYEQEFKYDFIVHPGGRVTDIKLHYSGADDISLAADGSLKINTPLSSITESPPYVYEQESKKEIFTKYTVQDSTVSFSAAAHQGTLIIDPGVDWATYFGGASLDLTSGIATDNQGNVYIVGTTLSTNNIATTGAHQTNWAGPTGTYGYDGFLAKFNSQGQLQWATYYGGNNNIPSFFGNENTADVACDPFGNIFIAGTTNSDNGIATAGSFQDAFNTNSLPGWGYLISNAYLAKFNTNGELQWGTYYGASTQINGFSAIACDKYGNVYAVGNTDSAAINSSIVTPGAFQPTYGGGMGLLTGDGQIVKFDNNGNRLWGTYFGGSSQDFLIESLVDIACDTNANIYITGYLSPEMGTPGAHIPICPNTWGDGFLAKLDSSGSRIWCSYIRGMTKSVSVNTYNHLYVSGSTPGSNFHYDSLITTPGAFMEQSTGQRCHFLMQMNPENGQRNWGTYYGGGYNNLSNLDYSNATACDAYGNVFLSGVTSTFALSPGSTTNLATPGSHQDTLNAPQPTTIGNNNSSSSTNDMFLVKFDSTGQRKWGTYYGGENDEGNQYGTNNGLAISNTGSIFLYGNTQSTTAIATPGAYQSSWAGDMDVFLVKFRPLDIAISHLIAPENDTLCTNTYPLSLRVKNQGQFDKTDPLVIHYSYIGSSNGSDSIVFTTTLAAGDSADYALGNIPLTLPGNYSFKVYINYTKDDDNRPNDTLRFNLFVIAPPVADVTSYYVGDTYYFTNNNAQPNDTYLWDFGDGQSSTLPEPTHVFAEGGTYPVVLTITNLCGSASDTILIDNGTTGIDNRELANQLSVYPNPAGKELFIKAPADTKLQSYALINSWGSMMQQGDISRSNVIRLGALASGVYTLRIQTDKGVVHRQVVIQRE